MANQFRVTCHKPDNYDKDRRIQGLGGPGGGGWYRGIDYLISAIEGGSEQYWTTAQDGKSVWVIVASRNGRKYLKTEADGLEPNNLLALPHCP
jgi:hypothetical protein